MGEVRKRGSQWEKHFLDYYNLEPALTTYILIGQNLVMCLCVTAGVAEKR